MSEANRSRESGDSVSVETEKREPSPQLQSPAIVRQPDSGRFGSDNIRLSAALCSLGFHLRDDAEPVTIAFPVDSSSAAESANPKSEIRNPKSIVTFWHRPEPDPSTPIAHLKNKNNEPLRIVAIDIKAWWDFPGKYSITGFDDALNAIRRALEWREWFLQLIHGQRQIVNQRFTKNSVVTTSLHTASILKACGFELLAMEGCAPSRPTNNNSVRFVFPAKAVGIVEQIERYRSPRRDDGRDSCADWMLSGLRFRDLLHKRAREAGCIPMVRIQDGERILSFSSQMDRTQRREMIRHF